MLVGLTTKRSGEGSLRWLTKEAFVKENLPYIMGTISLLVMILATAVSSATAAGTVTMETSGSGSISGHSYFSWSEMPVFRPEGTLYHHDTVRYSYNYNYNLWPEEPPVGDDFWTPGAGWGTRHSRYNRGWYNQQPTATDLSPDRASTTTAGSSVTWTARATDPDGDALRYKFWLKGPSTSWTWQDMTGWTSSSRWTWKTTLSDVGTSQICVSVKDGRHPGPDGSNSYLVRDYTITLPRSNEPPISSDLVQSPAGPLTAGSSATWTARATDPDGDPIYYRFWLKGPSTGNSWKDVTGWTTNNRWTMQTTSSDVGTNQVNVWIRDGKHAGNDGWDSYQVRDVTVIGSAPATNQPPAALNLAPDKVGPGKAGTRITWTVDARDPEGDRIYYRYWLKGPSTGNSWKDMTGWTANSRWTWKTTSSDVGANQVNVWIGDGKHAGYDGWDSYQVRDYAITW
jgi:hypothetical protein